MYRYIFTIIIVVCFLKSNGQSGKVRDQINTSFSCVKKSWSAANKALTEIQKCNIALSVNEIQSNAARASSEMDEALEEVKNAENEADGAVGEAQNINCTDAVECAGKAKKDFKKAKMKFDDALTKLNNATDEDRGDYLVDYLNSTLSVIEQGMTAMKKGIDELNETLKALEKCK